MSLQYLSKGRFRGWVDPTLEIPESILSNPESADQFTDAELLLDCRGRRIFRLPLKVNGSSQMCFLYLFRNSSLGRSLRRCYALHILSISTTLAAHGFETLDVFLAMKAKGEVLNWNSLLIAQEVEAVFELPSTGDHVFQTHDWISLDHEVASVLASELARFHEFGFVHGDLKSRHILLRKECLPDSKKQVVLVDLEKTRRYKRLPTILHDILAGRDLIQLLASLPPDILFKKEFLKIYVSTRHLTEARQKRLTHMLRLYEPGGSLTQGTTLLKSIVKHFRARKH